jgi:hypothetical protein
MRAKTAQAETLMKMGQIAAAEKLLNEVWAEQAKLAQDPSSPQPVMPPHFHNPGALDTEPGPSTHIGDNAELIAMTKADARNRTMRDISQYLSEPPKKDNAVGAHVTRTDGQKLSHLVLPGARKTAAFADHLLGADTSDMKDFDKFRRRAALINDEGRAMHYGGLPQKIDEFLTGVEFAPPPRKKTSMDSAIGRAYLSKLIKTASDPEAMPHERKKAAQAIKAIEAKIGVDPKALLS